MRVYANKNVHGRQSMLEMDDIDANMIMVGERTMY